MLDATPSHEAGQAWKTPIMQEPRRRTTLSPALIEKRSGHEGATVGIQMDELSPVWLAKLIRSIGVLALPFEGQRAWLAENWELPGAQPVSELAIELGDATLLADQFLALDWISPAILSELRRLDAYLDERSGPENSEFWTYEALRYHPDWEHARGLALRVLNRIN